MGQRHQIFLIARVKGHYRCIAAFHSQWLYGRMVLDAAGRVARAFINPINAAAIASELATLEVLDIGSISHKDTDDDDNPEIICPYITGLFLTSSRVEIVLNRIYKMSLQSIYDLPSQCHNDEGYTCFDLTVPGKPQYCFWWPGTGPLTATEYLSRSVDKEKRWSPLAIAILGHCPLVKLSTLAAVWPADFGEQFRPQEDSSARQSYHTRLPYSPTTRSAASAFDSLEALQDYSPTWGPTISSLQGGLWIAISDDEERRWRARRGAASEAGPVAALSAVSAASTINNILSASHELGCPSIQSALQSLVIQPGHLDILRKELLAVTSLNSNGVVLLAQLLSAEKAKAVDLKPWFSTGALEASRLLDLSDALQHADLLDISLSSTLTAEIVQALVARLPNLRHLLALGCPRLTALTTVLPLTSYLASMPLHEAVDQNRLREPRRYSPPECLRWVEDSDPPPSLSVVTFAPSLSLLSKSPETQRYGVELAHFGAEGVVLGFTFWMERLFDTEYRAGEGDCYFEMRAYFHPTGSVPVQNSIRVSFDDSPTYSLGCMPSLIKDVSADSGQVYPRMETSASTDGLTRVPRYAGWVLVFDTKGSMPYHQLLQTMSRRELAQHDLDRKGLGILICEHYAPRGETNIPEDADASSSDDDASSDPPAPPGDDELPQGVEVHIYNKSPSDAPNDAPLPLLPARDRLAPPSTPPPDSVPRPEYAFEWWDVRPGEEAKGLQPVERLSVREWVGRLPAGHGPVDPMVLEYCEHVLASLHVVLRGSTSDEA